MNLGILVVYLVDNDNEKLLDIHLDYINKYTLSSFKIYAGINLLLPRFKEKLAKFNFIKSIELDPYIGPDDPQRGTKEQTYYLEQLIKIAHNDGITHIAIMHPDSFPIKHGWDSYFAELLDQKWALISNYPAMSACMFFRTDIYVNSDFSLLPKIEEMNLDSWKNFQSINRTPHIVETGMGMAYQIEQKQQSWYKMDRTNRNQYHEYFAGIFDNRIFHLGSASEYKTRPVRDYENNSIYQRIRTKIANILPINFKQALKFLFPENVLFPEIKRNQNSFIVIREKMLNDIDDFFNYLTE